MIIGIISLLTSFIFSILNLPLEIIGLVLGVINRKNGGKNKLGIILNSISIAISVIIFIVIISSESFRSELNMLYNEMDYLYSDNYVAGKYDCTGVDSDTDEYIRTFYLNKDSTFIYGSYDDMSNNYAKGTYTFVDQHRTNYSGEARYFTIVLNGSMIPSNADFNTELTFGITSLNRKKQGVIMFTNSNRMYYCYEK